MKNLTMTYFHMANATLSSALNCFTSEFEMESGGANLLLSSDAGYCNLKNEKNLALILLLSLYPKNPFTA